MLTLLNKSWSDYINIRQGRFQTKLPGKKGKLHTDKKIISLAGYDNPTYLRH